MATKDYYLGLDMGTSSVGWAVTDNEYRLLRAKGKDLWGVRLFDEASPAAERRSHRIARRRTARQKARIGWLKMVFEPEIAKTDAGFFRRLDESMLHTEDKTGQHKYSLFIDDTFTDRDYFRRYPTIFHLRKALAESDSVHDVRLVCLALLNMYKHRGHFLNEGLSEDGIADFESVCNGLSETTELFDAVTDYDKLQHLLTDKGYAKRERKEAVMELLGIEKKDKHASEMIGAVCGLTVKLSVMFPETFAQEEGAIDKISFRASNYDEMEAQMADALDEEDFEVILRLKQLHDWALLSNIMHGHATISAARVASYEKHQKDLRVLKSLIQKHAPAEYKNMFRVMKADNYSAYVGSVKYKGKSERRTAKCDEEKFFASIEKLISSMPQDADTEYVLNELHAETFLPKQLTRENGVIPNQVFCSEMRMILEHAQQYLPFLKERDESGLTVSERILQMFQFHIPYYIGPLKNVEDNHAWVVRKAAGQVMPWNIEEKVDVEKTRERFIENLIKRCTYLSDEQVLPKNSLLYEKYMVLNELNNLRINGELPVELKQRLYIDLFRKGKRVTGKKLESYLKQNGWIDAEETPQLTGIDRDFAHTCANYAKFCALFGTETLSYEQEKTAEDMIRLATIYGDAKSLLKKILKEEYRDMLSDKQIDRIAGMRFKDWGRLSKGLLELEGADKETGEVQTLIRRMWENNRNLMELLSDNYTYMEEIRERSNEIDKSLSEMSYEDLDELYISAPVKRMVWQTIKIVRELESVLGKAPKRVFIEMARETNAPKKRTVSRKKKFLDLYKKCGEEGKAFVKHIESTEERRFRSKKLYLYYTQMGRCMYTGEVIDPENLFNDNLYDIDHIYPRHFVKDDSLDNNLVLVKKEKNARKSDAYPIEREIQSSQHAFWTSLYERELINKEKYHRLTRKTSFTAEERAGFISRQLVETRQGTKVIAQLMEKIFPDCEVVYSKAGNVSDFRHQFDLIKCREVNDFHHANDAYLNIVVGNAYYVKFTKDPRRFIAEYDKDRKANEYHMDKIFNFSIRRGNDTAWDTEDNASIGIVKSVMKRMTPLVTRRSFEAHGGLADQTIYPAVEAGKAKGVGYLPVKTADKRLHDTTKYGGFKKLTGSHFFLVEHTVKGKRIRTIETMPLYLADAYAGERLIEYCRDHLGLADPSVRVKLIKMYSLIKVDGFYLYLTGRSNDALLVSNAVEMKLDYERILYCKRLLNRLGDSSLSEEDDVINASFNLDLYDELTGKHELQIYGKRPNAIGAKLKEGREQFIHLTVDRQAYVLKQILQLSQLSNMGADLSDIGGSKRTGVATLNKKISERKEFLLVKSSPAGLFEKKINLLTV